MGVSVSTRIARSRGPTVSARSMVPLASTALPCKANVRSVGTRLVAVRLGRLLEIVHGPEVAQRAVRLRVRVEIQHHDIDRLVCRYQVGIAVRSPRVAHDPFNHAMDGVRARGVGGLTEAKQEKLLGAFARFGVLTIVYLSRA
jgi:hypothetical protein